MKKKEIENYPVYIEDDEIDLYELFLTLKRKRKVVILLTLFFTFIAATYAFFATPVYLSSSIALFPESNNKQLVSAETTAKLVNVITEHIKERNYKKISQLTGLTVDTIETLKDITVENPRRRGKDNTFELKIYGTNREKLLKASYKIVDYLNSNSYIRKIIEDEKSLKKEEIKELQNKLPQLTKLATEIETKIKASKKINILFNPLDLQTKILGIKNRINSLKFTLENKIHGYKIISSYVTDKPVKPKKTLIVVVGFVTGLFTGIFAAFFKEWLESVKNTRRREESE
ncbi:Wzz/FepE/Etk N-terminal domain-containing protein [Desulfurobacterium atlanticum]|uniref:LPS O-antigen chain length determinant protein, WzzB/FepE family n=1 Tax=Desulfurobacterium atlanticum TaxID=240169 RepID=A0A238YQ34_9BACT|nr:Wzz/FepE/Etk N-terminal domain-containing protein [Desulfurobacterium atlanticum]SNR72703.1 LPS O-antigen chain length determinant protein, WzzB/FepE family [Desulfurobacterium atlanticum]